MKRFILIISMAVSLLFLSENALSQCSPAACPPGPPTPALGAPTACIMCGLAQLENYSGVTDTLPNQTTWPGVFCGTVENNQWFAFAAPQASVTFSFTVSNCQGSQNPPGGGIQAEVYCTTDCTTDWTSVSNCWSPGSETNGTVTATSLTPGDIYYLMIDGWAGDVCDFTINITDPPGGGGPASLPAPSGITGDVEVCFPSATLSTYLLPAGSFCGSSLLWTIQPPNAGTIVSDPTAPSILVQWNVPGTANVCVQANNVCSVSPPGCFPVTITQIPPSTEEVDLCIGGTTICAGQVFTQPGVFPVVLQTDAGCDSLINCIITPIPPVSNDLGQVEFCAPAVYEICGNFFSSSGIYSQLCLGPNGCDSTVIVDLAIMEAIVIVEDPEEIGCDSNSQQVTLDATGSIFSVVPNGEVFFDWTGPSFCGPTTDITACVDQPGNYCLTITVERNGTSCSDTYCVDVIANNNVPDPPDLTGLSDVCDGDLEQYIVTVLGGPPPTGYTWTTPNGEPFTNVNPTTIEVDWTGSAGGDLCVTADNDCGPSTSVCLAINVSLGPEDPTFSGDDTVCEGDMENYAIDNVDLSATYTWTVPPGASFTDNGDNIDVDFSGASSGDICVEGANDCGMSAQFCLPITITDVPDDPVFTSGPTTVCDGDVENYCVDPVPGAVSYTWDTPEGNFPGSNDCISVDFTGSSTAQICVTADNDCGSSEQICMTVNVDEAPTAIISGGGSYCEGSGNTVDLTIDFTGTSPWTFNYTDGLNPNVTVTTSDNPYTLSVDTAGTYTLVDLDDDTDCPGTVDGEAIVTEDPAPTADLTGSGFICAGSGDTINLTITLTGTPDWTVNWTIDSLQQAALNITSSPFTLPITQSQAGEIEITNVTGGNGCDGTAAGMVTVNVNDAPQVTGITTMCDGTNTNFTVEFEISGGDPNSYSVTPNTGTLTTMPPYIFTSDPIPSGVGYSFVVNDINDCSPVTVEDNDGIICTCESMAGDMDDVPIDTCGNGPVTALYDNSVENFDADDTLVFILHEGSGLSILNPIDTNLTEPLFGFMSPPMSYGTTYYISAVVGNDDGNGTVDLSDPCLSVAQGTPVTFHNIPGGVLSGTTAICEGDNADLTIDFTGPGPWTIEYDDGSGIQTLTGITANPFTLTLSPPSSTTVTLTGVSNANCDGNAGGSADVTVHTAVQVSGENAQCNATATGFTVTFQISGGDPNTYSVSPPGSGTIDPSGLFTSNEIPAGNGYDFIVDDVNSCGPVTVSDPLVDCNCLTNVGDMDANAIDECGDGPITAPYDNTNETLDADDVLTFILHEGNGNAIVNEIARNETEATFGYMDPPMSYGTTYFISAVVGNDDGTGTVDLTDNCVAIAPGTPVTFFEVPSADLSGNPAICLGDCATLTIALTGDAPWEVVINDGTQDSTITGINSNPFNYQVCPTTTSNYTLTSVTDENCPGNISGTGSVTVNEAPFISNTVTIINGTNTAYTVTFEISGGDPATYAVSPNNGTLAGNTFTSNEIPCGNGYNFSVDDANGCGPDGISEPMVNCDCISQAGDTDGIPVEECGNGPVTVFYDDDNEVLDGNDVLCFMIHAGDNIPISTNDEPSFNFSPVTMTYGTTYFICAIAGDDNGNGCVDFSDDCLDIGLCTEVIYYELPSATMIGGADICTGETTDLVITFTGQAPWTLTYNLSTGPPVTETGITDNPHTIPVSPTVSTVFTLAEVTDDNDCSGNASGVAVVNVASPPFTTPAVRDCNSTNTGYTISFTINGGDPNSYSVLPPGSGTIDMLGVFTSNEIPDGQGYQFFIDDANGCGPIEVSDAAFDCPCTTWAGTIGPLTPINECGDDIAVTAVPEGNEILDGDDVLNFILHDGIPMMPVFISQTPDFVLSTSQLVYDVQYFICAVAGNDDGSGMVDFGDPCLSFTDQCVPISFHEIPTATISGDQAICENEDAIMTVDFTGPGPWTIIYESTQGGQVTETGITDNPFTLIEDVNSSDVFSLVGVSNDFCAGIVDGTANVQVTNAPDFDLNTLVFDCDPINFTYIVTVEITGGDPASYFVTGMPGTLNGNVFVSDPISGLTPFQFFVDDAVACGPTELTNVSPIPTGTISGDATICEGDQTTVTFTLTGVGPYDIEYLDVDGNTQTINTSQTVVTIDVSPTVDASVTLVSVTNPTTGCGNAPNESVNITVNPPAEAGVAGTPVEVCEGVSSDIDLNSLLTGADPGGQWFNSGGNPVSSTFNTGTQVAGTYNFTYVAGGLPPCPDDSETVTVIINQLPVADAGSGGQLTCDNITVTIGGSNTTPGMTYDWDADFGPFIGDSTQATADVNLPGTYTLTVTNTVTGCSSSDQTTVSQSVDLPEADLIVSDINCFGDNDGFITVNSVTNGVPPYMYSFNGGTFTDQTTYTNLGAGDYSLVVQDANGCATTYDFTLIQPEELNVEITGDFEGDEPTIQLGDSIFLRLEVSVPFGSLDAVTWFPPELFECDTCEQSWAYPPIQTTFNVTVVNDGCSAEDELTVFVKKTRPVYVPNIFSPNGDGVNDVLTIFGGKQVSRIKSFRIFNRWGEPVHEFRDFLPNDLTAGWDGTHRGQSLDPAVFAWFAEIEFIDGEVELYEGDVTLVR